MGQILGGPPLPPLNSSPGVYDSNHRTDLGARTTVSKLESNGFGNILV